MLATFTKVSCQESMVKSQGALAIFPSSPLFPRISLILNFAESSVDRFPNLGNFSRRILN